MGAAIRHQQLEGATALLKALAHTIRLAIVQEIATAGPCCVHELVDALDVPQPLVSQHLRILRTAGLLHAERQGQEVRYSLRDRHVWHIAEDAITHSHEQAADA